MLTPAFTSARSPCVTRSARAQRPGPLVAETLSEQNVTGRCINMCAQPPLFFLFSFQPVLCSLIHTSHTHTHTHHPHFYSAVRWNKEEHERQFRAVKYLWDIQKQAQARRQEEQESLAHDHSGNSSITTVSTASDDDNDDADGIDLNAAANRDAATVGSTLGRDPVFDRLYTGDSAGSGDSDADADAVPGLEEIPDKEVQHAAQQQQQQLGDAGQENSIGLEQYLGSADGAGAGEDGDESMVTITGPRAPRQLWDEDEVDEFDDQEELTPATLAGHSSPATIATITTTNSNISSSSSPSSSHAPQGRSLIQEISTSPTTTTTTTTTTTAPRSGVASRVLITELAGSEEDEDDVTENEDSDESDEVPEEITTGTQARWESITANQPRQQQQQQQEQQEQQEQREDGATAVGDSAGTRPLIQVVSSTDVEDLD